MGLATHKNRHFNRTVIFLFVHFTEIIFYYSLSDVASQQLSVILICLCCVRRTRKRGLVVLHSVVMLWRWINVFDVLVCVMIKEWVLNEFLKSTESGKGQRKAFSLLVCSVSSAVLKLFSFLFLTGCFCLFLCSLFQHYCYNKGGMRHTSYTCICGT